MSFEVIPDAVLETVDGGRSEGLMGALRVGLVGVSMLTGNPDIKAPQVNPVQPQIMQTVRTPVTQK